MNRNNIMLNEKIFSKNLKIPLVMIFLFLQGLYFSEAFAYIDPGSGSIIFQALIGALIGLGITLKIYWDKIKYKLSSRFQRE